MATIGENIKKARNKLGLIQDDLVRKSGVKHTTLTKIESDVVIKPSVQTVAKIAKALGVTIDPKNIMKKTFISSTFALVALFAFASGTAFAQNPQVALPSAGLTPESNFYFLDKFGEALREFFTFNPEGKARLQITFASERIAEIKVILETKGVEANGLEIAQSRLQAHLANAATIVVDQKAEGKDVSQLAKELGDKFDAPKTALEQTFKAEKRALEAQEKELKGKILEARRVGDTAQVESLIQQLGQIKAQKELLELKEEEAGEALEQEEERLEEEMEAKERAEKAIREAEKEKQEVLDEAVEDLEDAKEKEEELKEEQEEKEREAKEEQEETVKEGTEKDVERLEKEREKAEEATQKAEEQLRDAGDEEESN